MSKQPDIIFILSIVVIIGVIISNFVIIKPNHKTTDTSLLYSSYIPLQTDKNTHNNFKAGESEFSLFKLQDIKSQEFVHIDLSKQQTR